MFFAEYGLCYGNIRRSLLSHDVRFKCRILGVFRKRLAVVPVHFHVFHYIVIGYAFFGQLFLIYPPGLNEESYGGLVYVGEGIPGGKLLRSHSFRSINIGKLCHSGQYFLCIYIGIDL